MDKYTKFILTMIVVGIIGINFQLFGEDISGYIISKAEARHANNDIPTRVWRNHIVIDCDRIVIRFNSTA